MAVLEPLTFTKHSYECHACGGTKLCFMVVINNEGKPDDCPVIGITTVADWKDVAIREEAV